MERILFSSLRIERNDSDKRTIGCAVAHGRDGDSHIQDSRFAQRPQGGRQRITMLLAGFDGLASDIVGDLERLFDGPALSYQAGKIFRGGEVLALWELFNAYLERIRCIHHRLLLHLSA